MEITKVFVDQNQVLGNEVFVSGMEEVRANDYNPEGRQKVVFPRGIAIERRNFRFGGKRKHENVIVAEEMRTVKSK